MEGRGSLGPIFEERAWDQGYRRVGWGRRGYRDGKEGGEEWGIGLGGLCRHSFEHNGT